MYLKVLVPCFLAAVAQVVGYPSGAPYCDDTSPDGTVHGVKPSSDPFPYRIIVEKPNLKSGETTKVTIRVENDEDFFRGYLMTAKSGDERVGQFSSPDDQSHTIDCGPGSGNAATQSNASNKKEIVVNWTAPKDFKGTIHFEVAVVKVYAIVWVGERSEDVFVA